MKLPIYLDYSATTPVDPRVAETMIPYLCEHFGNPASRSHSFGWVADTAVEEAREQVAALVGAALPVTVGAILDAELDANPALVKSMSVQPPRGSGQVRTIRIGADNLIDLQPCGGTHVARTAEIGRVELGKIEKKGKQNRRVSLHLL